MCKLSLDINGVNNMVSEIRKYLDQKKTEHKQNEENIIKIISSEYSIDKIFTENKDISKIAKKLLSAL